MTDQLIAKFKYNVHHIKAKYFHCIITKAYIRMHKTIHKAIIYFTTLLKGTNSFTKVIKLL